MNVLSVLTVKFDTHPGKMRTLYLNSMQIFSPPHYAGIVQTHFPHIIFV